MNASSLDLRQLAMERPGNDALPPRPRRWVARYLVPFGILLGFATVLVVSLGQQWVPRPEVKVVPVVVQRGESTAAGEPLFQAAGWIEPRPTPVVITALTQGVIEELLVVEGQEVAKDEPVARLISIDAQLALQQAESELSIRQADWQQALALQKAARERLENPVHLKADLAAAESELAKKQTEYAMLPFLIQAAQARVVYARNNLDRKSQIREAVAGMVLEQAQRDHATATADRQELEQRGQYLSREIKALQDRVAALKSQSDLLIDERRQVGEATARVASAEALKQRAKLMLEQARLDRERTVIRAPQSGRILRLVASPGTRVMGLEHQSRQDASAIAEMYDPERLQVRADVRLEDVPLVVPGAPVMVTTASSQDPIRGQVLRPTSKANIQKNTLGVKVALIDPPVTVRPEMLVTATFLAPPSDDVSSDEKQVERLLVPRRVIQSIDSQPYVWCVDSQSIARQRSIELAADTRQQMVVVQNGLNPTDKLIAEGGDGISDGTSVHVTGEAALPDSRASNQNGRIP